VRRGLLLALLTLLGLGCSNAEKEAFVAERCRHVEADPRGYASCTADAAVDWDNGFR